MNLNQDAAAKLFEFVFVSISSTVFVGRTLAYGLLCTKSGRMGYLSDTSWRRDRLFQSATLGGKMESELLG